MAKDGIEVDDNGMDDLDSIMASLEGDYGEPEKPKNAREAVTTTIKDVGNGFVDELKSEPVEKIKKFLDTAVPRGIRNEYDFVKSTVSDVTDVFEKSASELKSNSKKTIDIIKTYTGESSAARKLLDKLSDKLGGNEESNSGYQEQSQDAIIAETLDGLFARQDVKESSRDISKEIKDNVKFEKETSLSNELISNMAMANDFNNTYTMNYYRKSIELKIKTLMVSKELLEATKMGYTSFKGQLEAIIKNTSLPDLIKLRSTEQFSETMNNRFRENMADMFYSSASPLESMKTNIIKKTTGVIESVKNGLSSGLMMAEQANSMKDMVDIPGVSKGELAGGELAQWISNTTAEYGSRFLEDHDGVREKLRNIKLMMTDPLDTLYGMADKEVDKNTLMSRVKARALRGLGRLSQTDEISTIKMRENAPDEASTFDYRTKNSIIKVIPMLLSKIYGEINSMRTKKEPSSLYYDYNSGTMEEGDQISTRIKKNVKSALNGVAGSNLDSIMSLLDNEGEEGMDNESKADIKSALLGHLAKDGSINPESLLKDNFLGTLSPEVSAIFKERYEGVMEKSKDEIRIIDDIKDYLYNIKTNTPFIDKLIKEFYSNGQISEIIKMGILDYDDSEGIYTVNKDKYNELLKKSIKEIATEDNLKENIKTSEYATSYDARNTGDEDSFMKIFHDAADAAGDSEFTKNATASLNTTLDKIKESETAKNLKQNFDDMLASESATKLKDGYTDVSKKITDNKTIQGVINTPIMDTAKNVKDKIAATTTNDIISSFKTAIEDVRNSDLNKKAKSTIEENYEKVKNIDTEKLKADAKKLTVEDVLSALKENYDDVSSVDIATKVLEGIEKLKESKMAKALEADYENIKSSDAVKKAKENYEKLIESETAKNTKENYDKLLESEAVKKAKANYEKLKESEAVKNAKANYDKMTNSETANDIKSKVNTVTEKIQSIKESPKEFVSWDNTNKSINDFISNAKNTVPDMMMERMNKIADSINMSPKEETVDAVNIESASGRDKKVFDKKDFTGMKFSTAMPDKSEYASVKPLPEKLKVLLGLDKIDADLMYSYYTQSVDKLQGVDLISWGKSLGYNFTNGIFIKAPVSNRINELKDKMLDFMERQTTSLLGGKKKGGGFKSFFGIKEGQTPLQILHSILKKTRSWDRKIMSKVPGLLKKTIKAPFKAIGMAGKAVGTVAGWRNISNLVRVLAGQEPVYPDKKKGILSTVKKVLDKTRKIDRATVRKAPGAAASVMKAPFKLGGIAKKGVVGSYTWATSVKPKADEVEKKIFGDQDGDGDVDNSWKDRFQNLEKEDDKAPTAAAPVEKKDTKKVDGFWGKLLGGLALALPILEKIWGGIKFAGKYIKKIGGGIYKLGGIVKGAFTGIGSLIMTALSKLGITGLATTAMTKLGFGAATGVAAKTAASVASAATTATAAATTAASTAAKVGATGAKVAEVTGVKVAGEAASVIKAAPKSRIATKFANSKILGVLKTFGKFITKRLGPKAAKSVLLTLGAKIASRAVPLLGLGLLAYDAGMIAKDMLTNGTSFKSAVSRQILGFDVFNDEDPILDENGNPVKPDEMTGEEFAKDSILDTYLEKDPDSEEAKKYMEEYGLKMEDIAKRKKQNENTSSTEYINKNTEDLRKSLEGRDYSNKAGGKLSDTLRDGGIDISNGEFTAIKGKEAIGKMLDKVSSMTGVDANTLKVFAAIESGMDPNAKAPTSSASGLFQFINSTWASMLNKHGDKYGIAKGTSQFDPMANALMGAEFLKENKQALSSVKKNVNTTDLYLAHFLGAGGARQILRSDTNARADTILPAAARSNNTIFYKNGKARTVGELYSFMENLVSNKAKKFGFVAGAQAANNPDHSKTATNPEKTNAADIEATNKNEKEPVKGGENGNVTNEASTGGNTTNVPNATVTNTDNLKDDKTKPPAAKEEFKPFVAASKNTVTNNDTNMDMSTTNSTLVASLEIQRSMDKSLSEILKILNKGNSDSSGSKTTDVKTPNPVEHKSEVPPTNNSGMPDSQVDLRKKRFG